jgi:hypothetical protein
MPAVRISRISWKEGWFERVGHRVAQAEMQRVSQHLFQHGAIYTKNTDDGWFGFKQEVIYE